MGDAPVRGLKPPGEISYRLVNALPNITGLPPATLDLPPAGVEVALVHPQIAPNTGNIARLCVAVGAKLHLVRPMGFVLSDRQLRRSAMDYWPRLNLTVHDDLPAFEAAMAGRRLWLFDSAGTAGLWETPFAADDVLVFGSESYGVPADFVARHPGRLVRIPQVAGERCLNLSTAAGVAVYEALRQIAGPAPHPQPSQTRPMR